MKVIHKESATFEDIDFFYHDEMSAIQDGKAHCYFTDYEKELFEKYGDCYLVIRKKDNKVLGSYKTYRDAIYETLGTYNISDFNIYRSDGDFNKDYFWLKTYTLEWTKHEEKEK